MRRESNYTHNEQVQCIEKKYLPVCKYTIDTINGI